MKEPTMFEGFKKQKLELLGNFNHALKLSRDIGDKDVEARLHNMVERLKSHVFSIAVAGEFSTGKSTLINALLGDTILPTALKACTAVVTKIRAVQNEEQPMISVLYKKSGRRTASLDELGSILTFDRADEDDETLEAEILVQRGTILDQGIEIVDTPGVNDPEARGEQVTLSYLPKADAIIYLTHAARSFKESEITFIKDRIAHEDSQRVIFAVNACDLIEDEEDWEDLRERGESVLPAHFAQNPKLFISAINALDEKKQSESKQSQELEPLEFELTQLILRERGEKEILRYRELLQLLILQLHRNLNGQIKDISLDQTLLERKVHRLGEAIGHLEKEKSKVTKTLQDSYLGFDQLMSQKVNQAISTLESGLDALSSKSKSGESRKDVRYLAEQNVSDHMKRTLTSLQSELRSRQDQISKRLSQSLQAALGEADLMIEPSSSTEIMRLHHIDFRDLVVVNTKQVEEDVEVRERVPFAVTEESVFMGGLGAMIGAAMLGPLGFWAGMMMGGSFGSMGSNYRTVTKKMREYFTVQTVETRQIASTCRERLVNTKEVALRQLEDKTTLDTLQVFDHKIAEYRNTINRLNTPTKNEVDKQARKAELEAQLQNLLPLLPQS